MKSPIVLNVIAIALIVFVVFCVSLYWYVREQVAFNTVLPARFTKEGFRLVEIGDNPQRVQDLVGEPLQVDEGGRIYVYSQARNPRQNFIHCSVIFGNDMKVVKKYWTLSD